MSNSVRPQRRQPTRLRRPWDSPGKNTGVVAISFSNAWKWKVKVKSLSRARLLATPWIAAYQASPSMGFSRQEYWNGVPLPSPSETLVTVNSLHWYERVFLFLIYFSSNEVAFLESPVFYRDLRSNSYAMWAHKISSTVSKWKSKSKSLAYSAWSYFPSILLHHFGLFHSLSLLSKTWSSLLYNYLSSPKGCDVQYSTDYITLCSPQILWKYPIIAYLGELFNQLHVSSSLTSFAYQGWNEFTEIKCGSPFFKIFCCSFSFRKHIYKHIHAQTLK